MSGHTPGPWHINKMRYVETGKPPTGRELRLTSGKPERWTINAAHWQVCEGTNCEADAALIAAAPELYELAKSALSELSYLRQQTETGQGDIILEMQLSEIIAKVEGR